MNCLVFNCGSSSIKTECFALSDLQSVFSASVERLNSTRPTLCCASTDSHPLPSNDPESALRALCERIKKEGIGLQVIAHRVVHGGENYSKAVRIDGSIERTIEALSVLAPLHNPLNLQGVRIAREYFPETEEIAVFDTAFYHSLPETSRIYALPQELTEKFSVRRYGFHGISHQYVATRAANFHKKPLESLALISCHLGAGASITAIRNGAPVDTSMGFTPLEGLVMEKRSGDIDPGALLFLIDKLGVRESKRILFEESGLKGLTGGDGDMRSVQSGIAAGDARCQLALDIFCYRVVKYIGAYALVLGKVDGIIFTGGIGEHQPLVRENIVAALEPLSVHLDSAANSNSESNSPSAFQISSTNSKVPVLVVPTNEMRGIAEQTRALLND